jgi:hypothetical protein
MADSNKEVPAIPKRNSNADSSRRWDGLYRALGLDPQKHNRPRPPPQPPPAEIFEGPVPRREKSPIERALEEHRYESYRRMFAGLNKRSDAGAGASPSDHPMSPSPSSPTAHPMHPRDRRFFVGLGWLAIPAALVAAGVWGGFSGYPHAGSAVAFVGLVVAYFMSLFLTERGPHKLRHPGPVVIGAAILSWAFIGWQTWMYFHPMVQGFTQQQVDQKIAAALEVDRAKRPAEKPLVPPGSVMTDLQAQQEIQSLQARVAQLEAENRNLQNRAASTPQPSDTYRNEMGLNQSAYLARDLSDILRRDTPVTVIITASDDENSKRFKEDLRVLLRVACGADSSIRCEFPDLPNPKTNLNAAIPEAQFPGLTIYQDEDSPSLKWGGLDYIAQIMRCFIVHTSVDVPRGISRLKSNPSNHVLWFQLGRGSPWIPNVQKNEQCAATHG